MLLWWLERWLTNRIPDPIKHTLVGPQLMNKSNAKPWFRLGNVQYEGDGINHADEAKW